MKESNLGEDLNIHIKDHKEILKAIEEIKEYENRFQEYNLLELEFKEELIEVDNQLEEFIEAIPKKEEKPKIRKKITFKRNKIKRTIERQLNPTVFHLRLNSEGKLENLDIKKLQIKQKTKKRIFKLKRNKKDKQKLEKTDEKSKISRFIGGLSKIKKAIPSRKKRTEDTKEPSE